MGHRGTTSPGEGLADAMPERSPPTGGEATPPITGRWDHGWSGWSGSPAVSRPELLSAGALPTHPSYPPSQRFGVVVKASTKPWPRQLGSNIVRAFPPPSEAGRCPPCVVSKDSGCPSCVVSKDTVGMPCGVSCRYATYCMPCAPGGAGTTHRYPHVRSDVL